jgi:hypothetical protein
MKPSNRKYQKQWTCDTIGSQTESAKNNLTFIGDQDVKISGIITQNIIQHSITKICADSYYIRQIVFRFCEGVLKYSHSRNPRCAPARTHGRTDKSKRPESHPTKECARARVRCLKTEPNYYCCPITLVMS